MEAVYKCDYCGEEFDTATYAIKCESSHIPIETIYKARWDKDGLYAEGVVIKYIDGHKEYYDRVGEA